MNRAVTQKYLQARFTARQSAGTARTKLDFFQRPLRVCRRAPSDELEKRTSRVRSKGQKVADSLSAFRCPRQKRGKPLSALPLLSIMHACRSPSFCEEVGISAASAFGAPPKHARITLVFIAVSANAWVSCPWHTSTEPVAMMSMCDISDDAPSCHLPLYVHGSRNPFLRFASLSTAMKRVEYPRLTNSLYDSAFVSELPPWCSRSSRSLASANVIPPNFAFQR